MIHKVGIVSDIHGNFPALESVWQAGSQAGVEKWWCLGDTVGYGPDAIRCLQFIFQNAEIVLLGNHESALVNDNIEKESIHSTEAFREGIAIATKQLEQLNHSEKETLVQKIHDLPEKQALTLQGNAIHLSHGNPLNPLSGHIGDAASAKEAFIEVQESLIFVGHSHTAGFSLWNDRYKACMYSANKYHMQNPLLISRYDRTLINPGTVGKGKPGLASWGILSITNGEDLCFEWQSTKYNIQLFE